MSTKTKTNAKPLTSAELEQVRQCVARVASLVRKSATAWLDVAKEFGSAKAKLRQHAYEAFYNEAGFTHSVANKLTLVSASKQLYDPTFKDLVSRVDGWSTLYEMTKLEKAKKLELLRRYVLDHPSTNVTRAIVQNIASNKPATEKTLVLVKVTSLESQFKLLTKEDLKALNVCISQAKTLLATAPSCVQFVAVEESIVAGLGGSTPETTSGKARVQHAAQVHAHVRDAEIERLAPKSLSETQRCLLSTTRFQFQEQQRIARSEAKKMPYDPSDEVSIEHPNHPFSVAKGWTVEQFQNHLKENNILLESDGIPDRPEYAKAYCADLGATALTGTDAERRASKKTLRDIVKGERRAKARGNVSKAVFARAVEATLKAETL